MSVFIFKPAYFCKIFKSVMVFSRNTLIFVTVNQKLLISKLKIYSNHAQTN